MRLRVLAVLIALLPALLVPGGLRFCLCLCACAEDSRAPDACCVVLEPSETSDARTPQVAATCADCAPIETTGAETREISKLVLDLDSWHVATSLEARDAAEPSAPRARLALYAERARAPLVLRDHPRPLLI